MKLPGRTAARKADPPAPPRATPSGAPRAATDGVDRDRVTADVPADGFDDPTDDVSDGIVAVTPPPLDPPPAPDRPAVPRAAAATRAGAPRSVTPRGARTGSEPIGVVRRGQRALGEDAGLTGTDALRARVRAAVVAELGPRLGTGAVDEAQVRRLLEQHLDDATRTSRVTVGPSERAQFLDQTLADMLGWGPLTPLMDDPEISEIMVNGLDAVFVERRGRILQTDVRFPTMASYRTVIDRMLAVAGRRVDEASPMADGRLPDGSRVNVIIPPLVVGEPVLTVRRFPEQGFTPEQLVELGSLSDGAVQFLHAAVSGRLNVVVSGGTGTGKTTLLNVLSGFVPPDERVITIEDAAELRLTQPHVVSLEARPANIEGAGQVTIRDLVRNALRMRPDRIVVGEVRDSAALDMLQAMNTGHEGSLTTVHANSPRDALSRIETMVLMAGLDLPLRAVREQIASAVDLVVQLARLGDGTRVVSAVTEVQGREGDTITLQDVFTRRSDGPLEPTGLRPKAAERLLERGVEVPASLFRSTATGEARTASARRPAARRTT